MIRGVKCWWTMRGELSVDGEGDVVGELSVVESAVFELETAA